MTMSNTKTTSLSVLRWVMTCLMLGILTGCSQTISKVVPKMVTSISPENAHIIEEGYGYLLMAVTTNQTIRRLHIDGPLNIVLTKADLQHGTNYILISLPEGEYNISKIKMGYSKFTFDEDDFWSFTVKRDTISYIGDLNTEFRGWFNNSVNYELVNRSSYALEFLESKYSQLLKTKSAFYSGYGTDRFLEIMTALRKPALAPQTATTGVENSLQGDVAQ